MSTPSPEMKAAASERAKLSAMRPASQPSISKALSSNSRCDALGRADSSCSGMLTRSICGVPVSNVVAVDAGSYDVLIDHAEAGAGWADETSARVETGTPRTRSAVCGSTR